MGDGNPIPGYFFLDYFSGSRKRSLVGEVMSIEILCEVINVPEGHKS